MTRGYSVWAGRERHFADPSALGSLAMRFFNPTPFNYAKACEIISTSKNPGFVPISNSVALEWDGTRHHLVLYKTRIITINPDNTHTIRTGGYRTRTTQERLSRYGYHIIKVRKGEWFVSLPQGDIPFEEDMTLPAA